MYPSCTQCSFTPETQRISKAPQSWGLARSQAPRISRQLYAGVCKSDDSLSLQKSHDILATPHTQKTVTVAKMSLTTSFSASWLSFCNRHFFLFFSWSGSTEHWQMASLNSHCPLTNVGESTKVHSNKIQHPTGGRGWRSSSSHHNIQCNWIWMNMNWICIM